jgi:hypothetical protein
MRSRPTRRRLAPDRLLEEIRASAGRETALLAERIIQHAGELGLTPVARHESVSLRLPLFGQPADSWVTLLVVSTVGTIFVNWLDRWSRLRGGNTLSTGYERALRRVLATEKVVFHPTAFRQAIPLSSLVQCADRLMSLLTDTTRALTARRGRRPAGEPHVALTPNIAALEGVPTETKQTCRGRNRRLRDEAFRRACGVCAVCRNDFRMLLQGDGQRVLQVHHLQQLAALDAPKVNSADDLAVLCANCHLLIHMDPRNALSIPALRRMLEEDGRYPMVPAP